ncbi:MAG: GNAT family N-acetyltransferase [Bacteroidales bacterium]|nr:GNAT family N-acetyltransferase [Bacteroidales bacterium]
MEITLVKFDNEFLNLSSLWLQDDEIRKLIDAAPINSKQQMVWFQGLIKRKDYKIWGVIAGNQKIGVCGLKNINKTEAEYFGYIGEKSFWGKGIGQKILKEILIKANSIRLSKVYLVVLTNNLRAIHSYKKFGFKEDGYSNDKVKMVISVC